MTDEPTRKQISEALSQHAKAIAEALAQIAHAPKELSQEDEPRLTGYHEDIERASREISKLMLTRKHPVFEDFGALIVYYPLSDMMSVRAMYGSQWYHHKYNVTQLGNE